MSLRCLQQRNATVELEQIKVFGLFLCALMCTLLGLSYGALEINVMQVFSEDSPEIQRVVFNEIRSPRVFLAGLVGAALSLSGAILQGLFRNPLADPGLIGVSSGAALGAVAMIVWGSQLELPQNILVYALPLAAVFRRFLRNDLPFFVLIHIRKFQSNYSAFGRDSRKRIRNSGYRTVPISSGRRTATLFGFLDYGKFWEGVLGRGITSCVPHNCWLGTVAEPEA
jgi:hypothetical protein